MDAKSPEDRIDLDRICASEDLAGLGLIQPHGCLVGVDASGRIQVASKNVRGFLKAAADDLLGAEAAGVHLADDRTVADWIARLAPVEGELSRATSPSVNGVPIEVFSHRTGDLTLLEVYVPDAAMDISEPDWADDRDAIEASASSFAASALAANAVRKHSGYHRVMVYRFLPDNSGEVIAESREEELSPFLGLRYPATDIPENARRLYLKSPIRIVADAKAEPSRVVSRDGAVCDLGLARLRAVSPYHIEYLKNMSVAATLVTSIVVGGRLWGLVACHHNKARIPSATAQAMAVDLTNALAQSIEVQEKEQADRLDGLIRQKAEAIYEEVLLEESLWYALLFGNNRAIRTLEVHGCAVRAGDEIFSLGHCPPSETIWEIEACGAAHCLSEQENEAHPVWTCTNLKEAIGDFAGITAGACVALVSEEPRASMMLFRNEVQREVYWGGNPDKSVSIDHENSRISPRQSFERWFSLVTDMSADWEALEVGVLRGLARLLTERPLAGPGVLVESSKQSRDRFSAIIFDREVSDVRSIIDDFIPEGIATIAFGTSRDPEFLDGFANASFCNLLGLNRSASNEPDLHNVLKVAGIAPSLLEMAANSETSIEIVSPTTGQRIMRASRIDLLCRHRRNSAAMGLSVIYLHDETERQRIIDALDAARRQNRANSLFKAEVLGGLSHELRTPLNAIIGYTEAMSLGIASSPEKAKEYARTVLDAGRLMLNLVEGLLDVAKLERGMLQIREAPFDLLHELKAVIGIAEVQGTERAQTMEFVDRIGALQMLGDAVAFRQIVLNVLGNAVKHSPAGGTIRITVERSQMGTLLLEVEDSGVGIAAEHRVRVFEPFSQLDPVDVRSSGGAGIGLSIVKAYTELHGGSVSIDDSPSLGGARFTMKFPSWRIKTA